MKLLLFDIDGTLISTQGAGMRAMQRAGAELFGETFSFEGVTAAGGLDPLILVAAAERCGVALADHHHATFMQAYCRLLPDELAASGAQVRVMPGVVDLLNTLRDDHRVTLGVLTGNYGVTARLKLCAAGIDPNVFVIHAFGDEAPDRPSLVPLAMRRFEALHGRAIAPRDVVVIGDTPRDVHAAATHGCQSVAVATGPYGLAALRATGADMVLADLSDAAALREMIGGSALSGAERA